MPEPLGTTALTPGFMIVHGNRLDDLRDLAVSWMRRYPLAPLESERVLVHSNGIAQWLKLALAEDPREDGGGIAAALEVQLPAQFLWQAYRAVLGRESIPEVSELDKAPLTWRLMRLLPGLLERPSSAPCNVSSPTMPTCASVINWPSAWPTCSTSTRSIAATGSTTGARVATSCARRTGRRARSVPTSAGRPNCGARCSPTSVPIAWPAAAPACTGASSRRCAPPARRALPRRVVVFGISSMPAQTLEALAALARFSQVLLCVHNPCRHHWADIVADKDLLRHEYRRQQRRAGVPADLDEDRQHQHAQPLLAAWGKQGRDYINLLDSYDDPDSYRNLFGEVNGGRIDLFSEEARTGCSASCRTISSNCARWRKPASTGRRWRRGATPRSASMWPTARSAKWRSSTTSCSPASTPIRA